MERVRVRLLLARAQAVLETADDRSPGGCLNGTINDVSADADPSPGVAIYDSVKDNDIGGVPDWTAVGGTSMATPIIAATYALADLAAGGPGKALIPGTFPAAYPYQASSGLTDIVGGSDGTCESARQYLCHAVAGYDGPTGLGTPSGTAAFAVNQAHELTIADPGPMVMAGGAKVYLALNVEPGTVSPTFSTTPGSLPGSLFVDANGILQGSAPAVPGVYLITVSATDTGLGTGSTSFDIVVLPSLKATILAQARSRSTARIIASRRRAARCGSTNAPARPARSGSSSPAAR